MSQYQIPNNQNYRRSYIDNAIATMGYDPTASFIEEADLVLIGKGGVYNSDLYVLKINNTAIEPNVFNFDQYGNLLPVSGGKDIIVN